jgi:hypothetical protein
MFFPLILELNAIAGRIFEALMLRKFKKGNKEFVYRRLQGKSIIFLK